MGLLKLATKMGCSPSSRSCGTKDLKLPGSNLNFTQGQLLALNTYFSDVVDNAECLTKDPVQEKNLVLIERLIQRLIVGVAVLDSRFSSKFLVTLEPFRLNNKPGNSLSYLVRLDELSSPPLCPDSGRPHCQLVEPEGGPQGFARLRISGPGSEQWAEFAGSQGCLRRYLATGESFSSLSFAFRISPAYIGVIIRQTLQALRDTLVPIFMPTPTEETLVQSAANFRDRWNFPNCVGAIDGKHVRIFCPKKSGSLYFNYKNYFSISMLALVDPNYKFLAVDVGSYGKEGDSGIFDKSEFGRLLGNSNFYPPDAPPPGSNTPLPHVIVGDEAFRLEKHIMKPFNRAAARADKLKAIFNYRLCRARRVSENSFALLSQVWRIYYSHISVAPEVADLLILVTCCLHNMLRDAYLEDNEEPYHVVDPQDAQPEYFSDFNRVGGFRQFEGFAVRDKFAQYFSGEGAVPWQETRI